MALEIVFKVVSKIADCCVPNIRAQIAYIISYESNVEKLQNELQNLEAAKDTVQRSVETAKQNGKEIFDHVKKWLEKVDDVVAEAKLFVNSEEHARVGCIGGSIPIPWTRHQLSIKAEDVAKEISEILTQAKFNDNEISYLPPVPVAFPPSARGYETLHSRTLILKEVMLALKDANIYKVGVYGMGGVGKSSLIKELAWQAERDGSFGKVIVATVTNSPDLKRIQGQLGDGLGLNFKEETEEGRARRLWDRIRKEGNILIIMDDIWKKLDLTEVGIPAGDAHKGCKLLLTSRYLNVLKNDMGTQQNFRLETLSQRESWSLFEKAAGDVVNDIGLQPTAIKVARGCKGLPLLIVTVANALKTQDLYAWEDALIQLTKYEDEGLASVALANEAIQLSYKYLPSDQHRSLFLLIFSQGKRSVHTEDLRIYGWGLGIFKNAERLADARNRLYKLIDDLKASCLLLEEGGREWVIMHDLVSEVAAKIASRVQPVFSVPWHSELEKWPKMDQLKNYKYISLPWCYMPQLPESFECPDLEMLVLASLDNDLKVPDHFFSRMREMKVLDLAGVTCSPSLPISLHLLTNLKALYLYQCILEDISIVSELTGLEILSLENSEIYKLPAAMGQLTNLRFLSLGNCSKLRFIPANLLSSLKCLEELYMESCYIQWEAEGTIQSNNASLSELRDLHHLKSLAVQIQDPSVMPRDLIIFGNLERFNILIGDEWKWSRNVSGYFDTSRTLHLKLNSTTTTHLDRGIKMLLNGVEDLHLAELNGVRNVLSDLDGQGFPLLKHLHIQNNAEMVHIIDSTERVHPYPYRAFPSLKSMVICNLINLEKICYGPLPILVFTKLQVIKVGGCSRLQNLFSFSMVRNLHQLLEIEISKCNFMTNIVEQGEEDFQINFPNTHSIKLEGLPKLISFYSKQWKTNIISEDSAEEYQDLSNPLPLFAEKVAMPSLETMRLSSINMEKLWDDVSASSWIQNLTSLIIDNCHRLTYLFSREMGRALVKLQYLEITDCPMLEEIFVLKGKLEKVVASEDDAGSSEIAFMKLEHLELVNLAKLTSFCNGNYSFKFPLLETLWVKKCPKMETFSYGNLSTPNLKKVHVWFSKWHWEGELNATIRKIFREEDSHED